MSKIILFDTEARDKLKKGIDILASAVKVTLGPKGRNVILEQPYGGTIMTKDGVSVAKAVALEDQIENIGAQMLKDVASKTVDLCGDGTTSSVVLAQDIVNRGFKLLAAGANPMDLKRGIDKGVVNVVATLKEQSKTISDSLEEIKQIATISANGEQHIGELISEAFGKVGKDGVITVEESRNAETFVEVVEGMKFDRGYISPYFVTNSEKMKVELQKPYILIYDRKISTMKEVLPLLEKVAISERSLLVICEDLDGEALQSLVHNKMTGKLKICVIKTPGFGENRRDILQDIATITNGIYISNDQGRKLDSVDLVDLGEAETIVVDKDSTLIVGGSGDKINIEARLLQIKNQISNTKIETSKIVLLDRLSKLSGGVAVLYVGAATEVEMKEKKDRVDDALHATRAAVEEGIVPGGGVALLRCLDNLKALITDSTDVSAGVNIIYSAIQAPLKTMLKNSDLDLTIVNEVIKGKDDYGFNVRTDTFENFYSTGVIDPTKVVRVALENAASIGSMLLTTECVIANKSNFLNT
jgi:chaperonin GroEL